MKEVTGAYQLDQREADGHLQSLQTSASLHQSVQLVRAHFPPVQAKVLHPRPAFTLGHCIEKILGYGSKFVALLHCWDSYSDWRERQKRDWMDNSPNSESPELSKGDVSDGGEMVQHPRMVADTFFYLNLEAGQS